jgi:hypothetical protein
MPSPHRQEEGQRTEENAAHAQLNYILEICAASGAMRRNNIVTEEAKLPPPTFTACKAGTCLHLYSLAGREQPWTHQTTPKKPGILLFIK